MSTRPFPPPESTSDRELGHASVREVLERVLDRGICLDLSARGAHHLSPVTGRIRVVAVQATLEHAQAVDFPPLNPARLPAAGRARWVA
jgi:hypothetical protein